ncbi:MULTISPECIES: hypothetical protein [Deinococcus]|uniref:hypothetical protein n=1 Tax=Deinococcus TaxID=1298 RepID=UPI0010558AB8|nr:MULTISPECIES: hypothetical protein [Deinococcus]TDE85967.1 hypothetical protein E0686_08970 [Deinococcus sp. S9]
MTTTEQALRAARGPVLPETLAQTTGRSPQDTLVDLSMLSLQGKAEEVGGRWRWTGPVGGIKGGTVRRKGETRPAPKPGTASRRPAQPYPIQVVSTRWKDPRTGRFVRTPHEGRPLKLKVARPKTTDGMIVTRIYKRDEATGLRVPVRYRVQYLEARAAHRRGELGAQELRELEQDLADGLLSEEGQAILAKVEAMRHSEEMGAAYRSDKAKRAAATRKANAARKKHRSGDAIRADHLKAQADLRVARERLQAARTERARQTYQTRVRNLNLKLGRLAKEAKAAGVTL